jgi:hypothetical protein
MKVFVTFDDKIKFLYDLLEIVKDNNYAIILEYDNYNEDECELIIENLKQDNIFEVEVPKTTRNHYSQTYILRAFKIKNNNYYLIANLFAFVASMCIYDKDEELFLIADELHKDCFSCLEKFYEKYKNKLKA